MNSVSENLSMAKSIYISRWFTARHLLIVGGCLGITSMYASRVNFSIAVIAMISSDTQLKNDTVNLSTSTTTKQTHFHYSNITTTTSSSSSSLSGEFEWGEYEQGIIHGSVYWGYIITQIPGGRLAEHFSATWVFGLGVLVSSILTFLSPVAARHGVWYLVTLRVVEGLAQGVTYPAMAYLLSSWCPPWERSTMITVVFSGVSLGTICGTYISGTVIELLEWPYAFYMTGVLGVIWFILWKLVAYDKPNQHPWISKAEKVYIESNATISTAEKSCNIPWKSIVMSLPFWSIMICHFCCNWLIFTFITDLPTYLKRILHYNIQQNSVRSSLPYLGSWLLSILCSLLCDFFIEKQILSITTARKIFNSIGFFVPSLMLLLVILIKCDQEELYILLVLTVMFSAVSTTGYFSNLLDISSNYSGTLTGIVNVIGTVPGWMAPYTVGYFTNEQPTRHQWNKVFYIACGLNIFAGVFYIIFATGEEQSWNKQKSSAEDTEIQILD